MRINVCHKERFASVFQFSPQFLDGIRTYLLLLDMCRLVQRSRRGTTSGQVILCARHNYICGILC
jgi:hypothetical protein